MYLARTMLLATIAVAAWPATASAQKFKFKLRQGDKLTYESDFEYTIETRAKTETSVSTSKLKMSRQWNVVSVDDLGVAAMELTVIAMRMERKDADGKTLLFDSKNLEKSDEQLVKQLSKAVGKPILRVQLAANGTVKGSKQLTDVKSVFPELPFQVSFPDEYVRVGLRWKRDFAVPLEAPLGRGEALQAHQICEITKMANDRVVVDIDTKMEKEPGDSAAKLAIAQFLPKGQVLLDVKRGVLLQSVMKVERTVPAGEGEDGEYRFVSKSTERLVDPEVASATKE